MLEKREFHYQNKGVGGGVSSGDSLLVSQEKKVNFPFNTFLLWTPIPFFTHLLGMNNLENPLS